MTVKAQGLEHLSLVAFIARSILQLDLSGRLLSTLQYQERLGIGSGKVQKALLELKKAGAVTRVSRGHQGTFVVAWDFPRLWDAARRLPVHILPPPRGSWKPRWSPRRWRGNARNGALLSPSAICAAPAPASRRR